MPQSEKKKKVYLKNIDLQTLSLLPIPMGITDMDNRFRWMSDMAVNMIGYSSLDEIVGLTDYDIKAPAVEFAPDFIKENHKVMHTQQTHHYFYSCYYQSDEPIFATAIKTPLYNDNDEVEAVLAVLHPMDSGKLQQFGHYLAEALPKFKHERKGQYCFECSDTFQGSVALSERQLEVLFLIIRGKSLQDVAGALGLSQRTVEDYVNVLKDKFHCMNKSQLIEKAVHLGYWTVIPKRFTYSP